MRIAHVTDCYLPRLGGIEMHVSDLARHQQRAGHEVEVITVSSPGTGAGPGDLGVGVLRLPAGGAHRRALRRYPEALGGLGACLRAGGYDVVHAHVAVFSPLATVAAAMAAAAGIPTVVTVHSLWTYWTPAFRAADHGLGWSAWPVVWTAVSELAAGPVRRAVGPGVRVEVLPNGVDVDFWRAPPVPRPENEVVVVSTMRLAPRKRPLPLLRMLRAARAQVPSQVRMSAVIIGDGPQRGSIERALARRGEGEWIQLAGRLRRSQVRELYRRADIYVAPANLESFGLAALEARCAGLPVVAKSGSAIPDFVTSGREGVLAATDAEMAAQIARLASCPAERAAMARHNRTTRPRQGWRGTLETAERLYARGAELQGRARPPQSLLAVQ